MLHVYGAYILYVKYFCSLSLSLSLSNKRQNRKQESFYLEEISKTEASMKQSSNGSQRTPSVTVSAKATTPEGRAGLYSKYMYIHVYS